MARGRMVSKTVATDKALNSLSLEAHLLYMMTVPHLDRDGLILGDAPVLQSIAVPRRQELSGRIDELVAEWIKAELVMAYESKDGRILYFRGFRKNNPELRYDREGASSLPPPPGMIRTPTGLVPDEHLQDSGASQDELRSKSGVSPDELPFKLREEKVREEEEKAAAEPAWWLSWKSSFPDGVNPLDKRNLQPTADKYGNDALVRAIEYANKGKRTPTITIRYVESILEGWDRDGKLNGNGAIPKERQPIKVQLPDGRIVDGTT